MNTDTILLPEDVKEIIYKECRALQFIARSYADQRIAGAYKSLHKGSGIEFEEARLYSPGDDARRIDWKISARKQQPYIKSFREEKETSLILVTDVSTSTHSGRTDSKLRKSVEVSAFLSSIAIFNQDTVGAIPFSHDYRTFIPPAKGIPATFRAMQGILTEAEKVRQEGFIKTPSSLVPCLLSTERLLRRKSIIFIISDFNFDVDFEKPLAALQKYHDVYAIRIKDSIEKEIPEKGIFAIRNPETGADYLINLSSPFERSKIIKQIEDHSEDLIQTFSRARVNYLELTEQDDMRSSLFSFFHERRARRA
ncbi:MAG TPA: DUF58 domain-containing protein [Oligoflexia bacterium]|nr:DUF58 domain-containing protein [Oligoflexia bacterium]HMP49029.1 DUF58 domain-containing protein [Oligoflexia bacterium]